MTPEGIENYRESLTRARAKELKRLKSENHMLRALLEFYKVYHAEVRIADIDGGSAIWVRGKQIR